MKIETVSRKELKNLITKPLGASKGEAGSVLIILGSDQYIGAGILAAIAALRSGVDIVGIAAPEAAALAINAHTPDIITYKFKGSHLTREHTNQLQKLVQKYTSILIGPGADLGEGFEKELIKLAMNEKKPLTLDADVSVIYPLKDLFETVILLNKSEYESFIEKNKLGKNLEDLHKSNPKAGKMSKDQLERERTMLEQENIVTHAKTNVILNKGPEDMLFTGDKIRVITGGSLRATVAGTGDVLAGLVAGFRAQGLNFRDATLAASVIMKRTAELLEEKKHYSFLASDYLRHLPIILKEMKIYRVVKHT